MEKEASLISSHCVEFAAFLKENSLIPYNDVYKEYVSHLIKEAVSFPYYLLTIIFRVQKNTAQEDGSYELLQILEANKEAYDAQVIPRR